VSHQLLTGLAWLQMWLGNRAVQHSHIQGAIKMVDLIGGPDKLGLDGFLRRVFFKIIADGGMPNPVDRMMATASPRAVTVSSY
jgi:hypothetical protein